MIIVQVVLALWLPLLGVQLVVGESTSPPSAQLVNWQNTTSKIPYSIWMAKSIWQRKQGNGLGRNGKPAISYEHGTYQQALFQLYEITKNHTYLEWIKEGVDAIVSPSGDIVDDYQLDAYSMDNVRNGEAIVKMYHLSREVKYQRAAAVLRSQLNGSPRTAEGAFWHKKRYFQQVWLDGLYMGLPFYSIHAATFENANNTVMDDIGRQFDLVWKHTRDAKTGLLRHGYDYSKTAVWADPITGASPEVWDRALGWYLMALVDLLSQDVGIPKQHPTRQILLDQLRTLIPAVVSNADPGTGAWPLVISQPLSRKGNYIETSGTCMYIYAMLKALRMGYIPFNDVIVKASRKAYEYIVKHHTFQNADGSLNMNGTVRVGSLDLAGDFEYYAGINVVVNDLKGTAPFIMASLEYERLSL